MATRPTMIGWFVDVSTWEPTTSQWQQALASLPLDEQQQVERFLFVKDKRLALGSRLLQRQLIHTVFNIPWAEITIARTPEGKPYWVQPATAHSRSWNYNVSHHGTIVAIACHHHALVGVDVVQLHERPKRRNGTENDDAFFRAFSDYFTATEWQFIRKSQDTADQFHAFYRLWSLKEAYIKAVGIGLGFQLLRAEFAPQQQPENPLNDWKMRLDGEIALQWRFRTAQIHDVSDPYLISVALGPQEDKWPSAVPIPKHHHPANETSFDLEVDFGWHEKSSSWWK